MKNFQTSWVKEFSEERPLLMDSTAMLWKLSRVSGTLPNWRRPDGQRSLSYWIGRSAVLLNFFIGVSVFGYVITQLVLTAMTASSIQPLMIHILYVCMGLMAVLCNLHWLTAWSRMQSLFEAWTAIEESPIVRKNSVYVSSDSSFRNGLLTSYALFALAWLAAFAFFEPTESFMLSFYPEVSRIFTPKFLRAFQMCCTFHLLLMIVLSEAVPALTYRRISMTVEALGEDVRTTYTILAKNRRPKSSAPSVIDHNAEVGKSSLFQDQLTEAWRYYEKIHRLLARSNQILGPLLIYAHAQAFVVICLFVYSFVSQIRSTDYLNLVRDFLVTVVFSARLIVSVVAADGLISSSTSLPTVVSQKLSQDWLLLSEEEIYFSQAFLQNLQDNALKVHPYDLYGLSQSLLLHMFNLCITYVIIMLQSI